MQYTIDRDNFRVREEDNGTMSFLNLQTMKIVFLNKTASLIFKNQEINDLYGLINLVSSKYIEADRNMIEHDCKELLYKMSSLEIITLNEKKKINNYIYVSGDNDYIDISLFIKKCVKNNKNILLCSTSDLNYFSAYMIRVRQFNHSEFNFVHADKMNNVDAVISCGVSPGGTAFTINNIFASLHQKEMLQEIINYIFSMTPELTKLRIMVTGILSADFYEVIKYLGFEEEAILKKEFGESNIICYSLFKK